MSQIFEALLTREQIEMFLDLLTERRDYILSDYEDDDYPYLVKIEGAISELKSAIGA
jgi:hypothetical protein